MDYGRLLARSWTITWRYKLLWFWGLLAVVGTGGGSALRILLNLLLNQGLINAESWASRFEAMLATPELFLSQLSFTLVGGVLFLLLVLLAGWLLFAWAEGAIIGGTLAAGSDQPVTPSATARRGAGLLGRFVAIDAAVFFPLFLLLLLIILLGGGALIGGMVAGIRSESAAGLLTPIALGGLCLLPLLCLLGPFSVVTAVFRGLAFREVALYGHGVRDTIRHAWTVVRAHWGPLLAVTGILWGLRVIVGTLTAVIHFPVMILTVPLSAAAPWLAFLLVGGLALALLVLEAVLHAYTAVVWTEAYVMAIGDR